MRLKKGFTLAEILMVLMVIGVIATMTVPSMMKGVTEAQTKAAYKKAFNVISNFAAMERVAGTLPAKHSNAATMQLYKALNSTLSVKSYAEFTAGSGILAVDDDYKTCITFPEVKGDPTIGEVSTPETTLGSGSSCGEGSMVLYSAETSTAAPWIITDDNIAYAIYTGASSTEVEINGKIETQAQTTCLTKQALTAVASDKDAEMGSCAVIVVDTNGLSKGPNVFEPQGYGANSDDNKLEKDKAYDTLTGDQYKIYIGRDGASAGPRTTTITGRLMADIK